MKLTPTKRTVVVAKPAVVYLYYYTLEALYHCYGKVFSIHLLVLKLMQTRNGVEGKRISSHSIQWLFVTAPLPKPRYMCTKDSRSTTVLSCSGPRRSRLIDTHSERTHYVNWYLVGQVARCETTCRICSSLNWNILTKQQYGLLVPGISSIIFSERAGWYIRSRTIDLEECRVARIQ